MGAEIITLGAHSNKPSQGPAAALREAWAWTKRQVTNPYAKLAVAAVTAPFAFSTALSGVIGVTQLATTGIMPPVGAMLSGAAIVGASILGAAVLLTAAAAGGVYGLLRLETKLDREQQDNSGPDAPPPAKKKRPKGRNKYSSLNGTKGEVIQLPRRGATRPSVAPAALSA